MHHRDAAILKRFALIVVMGYIIGLALQHSLN